MNRARVCGAGLVAVAITALAVPAAAAAAPANTGRPALAGIAREGQVLTTSTGTWTGVGDLSFAYAWQRCDAASCRAISGESSPTYTLATADVGLKVRSRVTATDSSGDSTTAYSYLSATIVPAAPVNTSRPALTGRAQPGFVIAASAGSWDGPGPFVFSYAWQRCDSACLTVAGANSASYEVAPADVGFRLRVLVTASNAGGSSTAASYLSASVAATPDTTYYIGLSGDDRNDGLSPATAWHTLVKASTVNLEPGDTVLLQAAATFPDTLTLSTEDAGTAKSPVTVDTYGGGKATLTAGVRLDGAAHIALGDLAVSNDSDTILLTDTTDITLHDLDVTGTRQSGVVTNLAEASGSHAIVLRDSTIHDLPGIGVNLTSNLDTGWTIADVAISHTGDSGILGIAADVTVDHCTILDTGLDGIIPYPRHGIYAKGPNWTITNNRIERFSTAGISFRRQGTVVEQNTIRTGRNGIAYSPEATAAGSEWIIGNTIENVTDYGIGSATAQTLQRFVVASNTIRTAGTYGMYFQSGPSLLIANNLILATGGTTSYLNIRPQTGNYTEQNNLYYGGSATAPFYWNGTPRSTAQYRTLSGQGAAMITTDPLLASDATPGTGSPAIDAGTPTIGPLAYTPSCDTTPLSYCSTAPDLGAHETGLPPS